MIKVEKIEDKMILELTGGSHILIDEFYQVLKAMYKVVGTSVKESAPFTAEDFLRTMVHDAATEVEKDVRERN